MRAGDAAVGARLVARAGLVEANLSAGTARYQVRELHGNPAHFPIREAILRDELKEDWAYVLRGERALSLAPLLACVVNEDGTGHGLFLAREVGSAPGKSVETVGLSGGKRKLTAPLG